MRVNSEAWYIRMAYWKGTPYQTTVCVLFWRIVWSYVRVVLIGVGAGAVVNTLALALIETYGLFGLAVPFLVIGLGIAAMALIAGASVAWGLARDSIGNAAADRAKRHPIIRARVRAFKDRVCPLVTFD